MFVEVLSGPDAWPLAYMLWADADGRVDRHSARFVSGTHPNGYGPSDLGLQEVITRNTVAALASTRSRQFALSWVDAQNRIHVGTRQTA